MAACRVGKAGGAHVGRAALVAPAGAVVAGQRPVLNLGRVAAHELDVARLHPEGGAEGGVVGLGD